MLISTFNVNSIRSRLHIVIPWLEEKRPDILCMQETKVTNDLFPQKNFEDIGYQVTFSGQKAYNGVAVASPHPIVNVIFGFEDGEDSKEDLARLIRCRIMGIDLVNTYVPQGRAVDHPNFKYKLRWLSRLMALFNGAYSPALDIIWCGDLNVAIEPIDVYAPETKEGHVCYHRDVREGLKDLMDWGFEDIFRRFHPEKNQYTFYDYRIPNAVKRRLGWRIDYIMATSGMGKKASGSYIDMEPRLKEKPSDHTFLQAEFRLD